MTDQLRIEYMPLSDLITRMDKFVYVETTGKIVAGHGRIETLTQKKQARMKAPERIEVRADDWYVPVQRGVAFKTDSESQARVSKRKVA